MKKFYPGDLKRGEKKRYRGEKLYPKKIFKKKKKTRLALDQKN